MTQTPYDVLGVPRKAGDEAIRAAFCKAAKANHPDLNAGDPAKEQKLKQVIAAYGVLKDAQQRALYDQALADYEQDVRSRRRQALPRRRIVFRPKLSTSRRGRLLAADASGTIFASGVKITSKSFSFHGSVNSRRCHVARATTPVPWLSSRGSRARASMPNSASWLSPSRWVSGDVPAFHPAIIDRREFG